MTSANRTPAFEQDHEEEDAAVLAHTRGTDRTMKWSAYKRARWNDSRLDKMVETNDSIKDSTRCARGGRSLLITRTTLGDQRIAHHSSLASCRVSRQVVYNALDPSSSWSSSSESGHVEGKSSALARRYQ